MANANQGTVTRLKLGKTEEISDGRVVRWLELPFGDHPFWLPVNLLPGHLKKGDYVALTAIESTEKLFLEQRDDLT